MLLSLGVSRRTTPLPTVFALSQVVKPATEGAGKCIANSLLFVAYLMLHIKIQWMGSGVSWHLTTTTTVFCSIKIIFYDRLFTRQILLRHAANVCRFHYLKWLPTFKLWFCYRGLAAGAHVQQGEFIYYLFINSLYPSRIRSVFGKEKCRFVERYQKNRFHGESDQWWGQESNSHVLFHMSNHTAHLVAF